MIEDDEERGPGPAQEPRGTPEDANSTSVDDQAVYHEALMGPGGADSQALHFATRLVKRGAVVWVASQRTDKVEFDRPSGWPKLSVDGSLDRIMQFRPGMALCVNTGGVLVVVDVDPRNGGDIEKVRNLLVELKVRVFAEVVTPSGGQHFYIAGHPALSTVHSTIKNGKLPGFPGVDVQSLGANVFLPGTQRPKYGGAGYTIVFNALDALADGGDPDGAESFSQWVAKCVGQTAKKREGAGDSDFTFERSRPWNGAAPDTRQQAYLDTVLLENAKTVAQTPPGGRNDALYLASLKCASLVAGAGMDQQLVVDVLEDAATDCGLTEDDGVKAVHATIASAFKNGLQNPKAVPDRPDHVVDFDADPSAPAASDDYPVNPYPPFTADDFRQLASGVKPEPRTQSRVLQVVADATWDHPVKHRSYQHPWCATCLDAWRVASGFSMTDMDSSRVARSRAARYLLLRNNPPADSFDPDVEVDNLDDEFLLGNQLDELPAPESLIDGVLTRHAYGIIRGRDASFKSFITLDWALCLATGTRWQGRATERVKVLYVAGEGAYGLAERKRAWESAHGVAVDPEWFVVRTSAVNLYRTGAAFDHLLCHIKDGGYGLVVFDTLRRMSGGAEGNGSDMGVVVDNLERVKRLTDDGTVLAVAHTDKGDNDTRGFSGIEDDADIVWSVKREGYLKEVRLTCVKMKDGPDGHKIDLRLRAEGESLVVLRGDPTLSEMLSGTGVRESDEKIMAAMHEQFVDVGATVTDLIKATGLSKNTVYRSRSRLVDAGRLRVEKRPARLFLGRAEVCTEKTRIGQVGKNWVIPSPFPRPVPQQGRGGSDLT